MATSRELLPMLGFLSFAFIYNSVALAPILLELAEEFRTTAGEAGLLVAAYSVPSIGLAHLIGPYSDRLGRRPFLVGGAILSGAATILAAGSSSYVMLGLLRLVGGIGVAAVMPSLQVVIAERFDYRTRGTAAGHVISAQTAATIVGVPLSGIVASALSWRLSLVIVGLLTLAAAWLLARRFADLPRRPSRGTTALYWMILRDRHAMFAILAAFLGSTFWFTWSTYFVSFFQTTFSLPLALASVLSATTGIGVLIGSNIGGRLGDRIGHRAVLAASLFASAGLIVALTNLAIGVVVATALNLALCSASGARMPTNNAVLGEQMPDAQGTMWGIVWSAISLAVVTGVAVGGTLIDTRGYAALGLFAGVAATASGIVVAWLVRGERSPALRSPT
jgi:predicted MFS family arabinose efflux permease